MGLTLSKTRQTMLIINWHDILPLLYFDEIDYDSSDGLVAIYDGLIAL